MAELRHFGRAAESCNVSQPTLSSQIRKLEEELGVTLLERTNKRVDVTPVGRQILEHAQRVLNEAGQIEAVARAARDPLVGPLRLGIIPTLAPYLLPLILAPLKKAYPGLEIELWEDQTRLLLEGLRSHRLDAALVASALGSHEVSETALFAEPLVAVLPLGHKLTLRKGAVDEDELSGDLLVMADGHCLANQSLAACGAKAGVQPAMQAATLETLVNLVAAGYGTTLIPALAKDGVVGRGVELRALKQGSTRVIRMACRKGFPRPQALKAVERVVRAAVPKDWTRGGTV